MDHPRSTEFHTNMNTPIELHNKSSINFLFLSVGSKKESRSITSFANLPYERRHRNGNCYTKISFVIPFAAWVMSIIWSFANRDKLRCGLTAETVDYVRRRKRWSKVFVISFVITSALWGGFLLVSLGGLVAFRDINWYEKAFYLLVVSYLVIVWNLAARGGAKLLFEDNDDLFFHYDGALYNLRGILESYKAKFGVPRNLQKGIKESERLNWYLKRIHKHYFRPKWIL